MGNLITAKSHHVLLGSIILGFFILALFISFSNRIEGDAAFHALVSREIYEKEKIIDSTSYLLANEKNNFPIAYPQVFHLTGALLYMYIGTTAFLILPVLYGVLCLIFLTIILYNLHKNLTAIVLGISILAFNVYFLDFSSKYFMETSLVLSVLVALTYSIKYVKDKNLSNFYVASLFFGLSLAIKQQGLFAFPVFVLLIYFSYRLHKSFKQIFIGVLFFVLISAGPMLQLFYSTGSILYAGDNQPKIVQLIETPVRNLLGIKAIEGDKLWGTLNKGRREDEILTWRDLSNNTSAWIIQDSATSISWAALTGILLIILLIRVIKMRKITDLLVLIFLVSFYFLLYYLARPRYALPLIVMPSVTMFYIISTALLLRINRHAVSLFVALLVMYTLSNFSGGIIDTISRDDYGYYRAYNKNRSSELQELYDAVKSETRSAYTLASPLPYESAFYTTHTTVWANPYGASDLFEALLGLDERDAAEVLRRYQIKYLIIYNDRFMKYTNWAGITPSNGFLKSLDNSQYFKLLKENTSGKIYVMHYQ